MKLVAFRIQNFRSIVDSGWCDLSIDDITTIIGQNESGKSALLDALYNFYRPSLDDDSLRSDGTYPEISCTFKLSRSDVADLFGDNEIPKSFRSSLTAAGSKITLTRTWSEVDDSTVQIDDKKLKELLEDQAEEVRLQAEEQARLKAERAAEKAAAAAEAEAQASAAQAAETVAPGTVVTQPTAAPAPATVTTSPQPTQDEEDEDDTAESRQILGYSGFIDAFFRAMPEFVMFTDGASFLPATIDLDDVVASKKDTEGITGANNFLALTGLTPDDILHKSLRRSGVKIRQANKKLTADFRAFWQQFIGTEANKVEIEVELKNYDSSVKSRAGKPYLVFWVKNGEELLKPAQRSKGLQWFLSFFLQLRASGLTSAKKQILLIDEPGQSLHIKAQEDILKVFEASKRSFQIVYTTHSPHLIQASSLHRLLAVERSGDEVNLGESKVFSARKKFQGASIDTLFPIYTLIGADLGSQAVVHRQNNVILEEPSGFYYLMSFLALTGEKHEMHFLPATGVANVRKLVNLFLGWGIDFLVVVDDDSHGNQQLDLIEKDVYGGKTAESEKHLMKITGCEGIEDMFGKTDFRKHVLNGAGTPYTESNSQYLKTTTLSKPLLAIEFYQKVKDGKLTLSDLSKKSQDNINNLVSEITTHLNELAKKDT